MYALAQWLTALNEKFGKLSSWMTGLLVLLVFLDVVIRYIFNFTFIWMVELETYFFAIGFLFVSGYAFTHDKHVRVDVFYAQMSDKKKASVDFWGGILFLIPWTLVSIVVSFNYFSFSWKFKESSSQPGGLPALYLLKLCVVVGFFLLFLQGIASIINAYGRMQSNNSKKQIS